MHIKIKFLQKLPKELLIIVLLDITEPFLRMDKLDLVKHSQLQEKFNTVARWYNSERLPRAVSVS